MTPHFFFCYLPSWGQWVNRQVGTIEVLMKWPGGLSVSVAMVTTHHFICPKVNVARQNEEITARRNCSIDKSQIDYLV